MAPTARHAPGGLGPQFTLVGVNPALDDFSEPALVVHKEARETAIAAGRALADRF